MVVVGGVILVVHAESSVYMSQVGMVIQLGERAVGMLSLAVEAFENVVS